MARRATSDPHAARMSIGEHIEEMRRRMIYALLGVGLLTGIGLVFGRIVIIPWLCVPLAQAQKAAGISPQTYGFSPTTAFAVYMKVSLATGLILGAPWVLYQGWKFIELGLYQAERKIVLILAPFSVMMTLMGVAFMYYIMLPACLMFLIFFSTTFPAIGADEPGWLFGLLAPKRPTQTLVDNRSQTIHNNPLQVPLLQLDPTDPEEGHVWIKMSEGELRFYVNGEIRRITSATPSLLNPLIEINQYLGFVTLLALGIVLAFQLPLVMLMLGWSGLVDPVLLAKYRGYCIFACFAIGMVLTPQDVISMVLLALPLWGLFEFGLLLMRFVQRRRG